MGVSNERDVNTDMNLKSLKASTAEVTLNDFDLFHGSISFLCQVPLWVDKEIMEHPNYSNN